VPPYLSPSSAFPDPSTVLFPPHGSRHPHKPWRLPFTCRQNRRSTPAGNSAGTGGSVTTPIAIPPEVCFFFHRKNLPRAMGKPRLFKGFIRARLSRL